MKAFFAKKIVKEKEIINDAYLIVDQGKIADIKKDINKNDLEIKNYEDLTIAPGFIDIHTHGALGYEPGFGDENGLWKWANFKMENGVTGFYPSTASIPLENIKKACKNVTKNKNKSNSNVLGMHMEGPFFSEGKKIGAQNPEHVLQKFPEEFKQFIKKNSDIINLLTLDPLIADAEEIVQFCNKEGIKVSAGHSEILYEDFVEINDGYSSLTHTFNGMLGLHHRNPGLAYAGCMDQNLYSEIICDGFHVIYPILDMFFKLKGFEKSILVTDSMLATGMSPGSSYEIGEMDVTVSDEGKVFKEDGSLAGSTLTINTAVKNITKNIDISLLQAVNLASRNPAKLMGIFDKKGSLAKDKDADFIILDDELNVQETYIGGDKVTPISS